MDNSALFTLSYGLYVIGAVQGEKRNGMINNTLIQVTSTPLRVALTMNKDGLTHDMIAATGQFSASILCEGADFALFQHFGFRSGKTCDKFDATYAWAQDEQGLPYLTELACARFSCKVVQALDLGTHTMFLADVVDAQRLQRQSPITYADYHARIKSAAPPPPPPSESKTRRFRCKICGYIYEGDFLPADFICPICKHGAEDFEEI